MYKNVNPDALQLLMKDLKTKFPDKFADPRDVCVFSAFLRDNPEDFDRVKRAYDGIGGLNDNDLQEIVAEIFKKALK